MTAEATKVLIIKNKYLNYKINYHLINFTLQFEELKGLDKKYYQPYSFYYSGTSFFEELNEKTKKKFLKRRNNTFLGSITHFMRSLAHKELEENSFRIFNGHFETQPYRYLQIDKIEGMTRVTISQPKLTILYNNEEQSFIQLVEEKDSTNFYIDNLGNFYPSNLFFFGGQMGIKRVANLLPLNYKVN